MFKKASTLVNKRVILSCFTLLITFLSQIVFAQRNHKLSIGFGGGYGFSLAGKRLGSNLIYTTTSTTGEGVYGTWGVGSNYYGKAELQISPEISAGIEADYIDGKHWTWTTHVNGNSSTIFDYFDTHYYNFSLTALVTLHPRIIYRFSPYVDMGIEVNLYSRLGQNQGENQVSGNSTIRYYVEGSTSAIRNLGFRGAAGCKYRINKHWSVNAELDINATSFSQDELLYHKYTINETNQLGSLTNSQKHIQYFKKFTVSNSSPDQPSKALRSPDPASSFGVRGGVVYAFELKHHKRR